MTEQESNLDEYVAKMKSEGGLEKRQRDLAQEAINRRTRLTNAFNSARRACRFDICFSEHDYDVETLPKDWDVTLASWQSRRLIETGIVLAIDEWEESLANLSVESQEKRIAIDIMSSAMRAAKHAVENFTQETGSKPTAENFETIVKNALLTNHGRSLKKQLASLISICSNNTDKTGRPIIDIADRKKLDPVYICIKNKIERDLIDSDLPPAIKPKAIASVSTGRVTKKRKKPGSPVAPDELDAPNATSPVVVKPKRSTVKGEARVKLIGALTRHHKYADGSCLNCEPIGVNAIGRLAGVTGASASRFFNKEFKGQLHYKQMCHNNTKLITALKMLNQEFSPHALNDLNRVGEGDVEEGD